MIEEHLVSQIEDLFTQEELPGGVWAMTALGQPGVPAVPDRPYIVWKELPSAPYEEVSEQSDVELRAFQFFIYDVKGDFTRINKYLKRIHNLVRTIAPFETEEDRCSGAFWGGKSMTFMDDGYDSATRYGVARFAVSSK